MNLSQNDLDLIIRLISVKLGPSADEAEINNLANEVIIRISAQSDAVSELTPKSAIIQEAPEVKEQPNPALEKRLIINAFGINRDTPEEKIKSYIRDKKLSIIAVSSNKIDSFRSLIMILDYSSFSGNLNLLKFDLDAICRDYGYKAIIQDSEYYGF